jgi:AmmeMemoRadiSam system protein B
MKHTFNIYLSVVILSTTFFSCQNNLRVKGPDYKIRPLKDTIGFAQYPWQMDSLMARIDRAGWNKTTGSKWNLVICPHDDYTYVGKLYPELLQNIKAPNLILIGVAHKAAQLSVEDSLVFDSYSAWKGPWKNVPVSPAREEIYNLLKGKYAVINDTLQKVEHSVEAMIPYLQYFNKNITIVPILVPAMSPDRMEACGKALADAIRIVAKNHKWEWGTDYAIVVTTDAVHYGNEDWGGINRAYFGCDENGNIKARDHEKGIIDSCFTNKVSPEKIRLFNSFTLNQQNFREYKWTWCGRYCVPVALYASYYLNDSKPLSGELIGYSTSITSPHISVEDIRMGMTAIATDCHWVGYAALGYTLQDTKQMGIVTLSTINLRKEPHHSAELVSQAILGTPVKILNTGDSWLKIQTPDNYTGWIEEASIKPVNIAEMESWKKAAKVIYMENTGWLYNSASLKSGVVGDVVGGSIIEKVGESAGYVIVELPDGRKGFIEKEKVLDFKEWKKIVSSTEDNVCSMSLTYLGLPYLWGGTSTKGVDCSGLVQSVFFRNGIILPRDASLQAAHGFQVDISDGFSRLRKGDLLFFGSKNNGTSHVTHVAIYLGNNEYINSSGRVQINSLDPAKEDYNSRGMNSLLLAKRIIGVKNDQGIEYVNKHLWY